MLGVAIGAIRDPDGLSSPQWAYQWFLDGVATGFRGDSFSLSATRGVRAGSFVFVRVSFTDDLGNRYTLGSNTVTVRPVRGVVTPDPDPDPVVPTPDPPNPDPDPDPPAPEVDSPPTGRTVHNPLIPEPRIRQAISCLLYTSPSPRDS